MSVMLLVPGLEKAQSELLRKARDFSCFFLASLCHQLDDSHKFFMIILFERLVQRRFLPVTPRNNGKSMTLATRRNSKSLQTNRLST